jgi:hypothetical protein
MIGKLLEIARKKRAAQPVDLYRPVAHTGLWHRGW